MKKYVYSEAKQVVVCGDFARAQRSHNLGWWGCKSSGTSSRLFYMHYCEYRTFKPLSAPMCRRCYIFMIAVLEGVESLTLEHTIWLYLHPIPHCRAQRLAA